MSFRYMNQKSDYPNLSLKQKDCPSDPLHLFSQWFAEVEHEPDNVIFEANAMTLATVGEGGMPHARIVLLKAYSPDGYVFFTNYESCKGLDIAHNPQVSLLFWWPSFFRQVRIEGCVQKLPAHDSDQYFSQRPIESQVAACASRQSQPLASKQVLLDTYRQVESTINQQGQLTRPAHWGGYIVSPRRYEFWQGCSHRMHDRLQYSLSSGDWHLSRLSP